jgi:hypothetical protein
LTWGGEASGAGASRRAEIRRPSLGLAVSAMFTSAGASAGSSMSASRIRIYVAVCSCNQSKSILNQNFGPARLILRNHKNVHTLLERRSECVSQYRDFGPRNLRNGWSQHCLTSTGFLWPRCVLDDLITTSCAISISYFLGSITYTHPGLRGSFSM